MAFVNVPRDSRLRLAAQLWVRGAERPHSLKNRLSRKEVSKSLFNGGVKEKPPSTSSIGQVSMTPLPEESGWGGDATHQ